MLTCFCISLSGCGGVTPNAPAPATAGSARTEAATAHADSAHAHIAPHGGQVQSVGDNHFELVYENKPGRLVLYVLAENETVAAPISAREIPLQVRDERTGDFQSFQLVTEPMEGEDDGKSSRFAAASDTLTRLENFTAVARVLVGGDSHRVSFQFVNGRPISAGVANLSDGFACPMACERSKVYSQPGKCPVCKMKLEEHKAGATAHADHNPKHGGTFFMAPDNWHHLEGTLVSERELRIYLYDNFTKPLDSTGYAGELKVQTVNEQDEEVGDVVVAPIKPVEGKPYLVAELPDTARLPFQSEARLQFPKAREEYVFNFDFKEVQQTELKGVKR
jgi:hypothetical protein